MFCFLFVGNCKNLHYSR